MGKKPRDYQIGCSSYARLNKGLLVGLQKLTNYITQSLKEWLASDLSDAVT